MPTAIEIFKHLPKKNCGKCNYPTCLAFAMQMANQKAKLEECPFVSEEAKAILAASSAPPIRLVKIGAGKDALEMGDETELYRHEKKFFHPTLFAVSISDSLPEPEIRAKLLKVKSMRFERVGQMLKFDLIEVRNETNDPSRFAAAVEIVAKDADMPLVLSSSNPEALHAGAARVAGKAPLLDGATADNFAAMAAVAKQTKCPLVVREEKGLDQLADLVAKVKQAGIENIVVDFGGSNLRELLERSTVVRRVSVRKTFRGLGYPILVRAGGGEKAVLRGMVATMKYGSVVVFDDIEEAHALPLFVLRQNIFTDPQVPIQVKPGLYPVGNPTEKAPILFTTNFSLTYFTVLADIEKSRVPVWLQVVDSEGLSVMTAFAAGKLTPESVVKALEESGAKEKSTRGEIVIPGMVSRMSGKLQDASNLKVLVGPKESSGLPKFLKALP
jgi:acetyl-CoA decarbonylase/synthase complex subunit gamma